MSQNIKKVHWAFDPYSEVSESWERSAEILRLISKRNEIEITPVYYLGQDLIHWVSNITPAQVEGLLPIVKKAMTDKLKQFDDLKLNEPVVEFAHGASLRKDAEIAARHLKAENSDLVILNTHARKSFKRLVLGSFAENLLLQTDRPLLFVSPNTGPITSIDNMLYPTDFAEKGLAAFESSVGKYSDLSKTITFYSKVISPLSAFAQETSHALGGGWVSVDQFISNIAGERRHAAEAWKQKAVASEMKTQLNLDEAPGVFIDDLLKEVEKDEYDLVALPSFAGGAESVLVGSVARELIRNSHKPVLVHHIEE